MNLQAKIIGCFLAVVGVSGGGLGCSSIPSDRPELGGVTGIVTLDDKPLPGVTVMFTPKHGRSSMTLTDERGHYELSYLWDTKGATLGRHTVSVSAAQEDDDLGARSPQVRAQIPDRYNTKTTLTAEVQAGDNTIDILLVSN